MTREKIISLIPFLSILVIFFVLFFIKGYLYMDLDFGWHIAMGNYIQAHGIPKTDPLSYTMPSYPIVDLEWFTNILLASLFINSSLLILSILFTLICFSAVIIQVQRKQFLWFLLPALFAIAILFGPFAVRTQVISWLFFSLLIKILYDHLSWQRYRSMVPLLMLIWANMHGSFMLANVVLVLYGCFLLFSKKATKLDLLLIVASIAATLLTPYGIRLWHEVWIQSTDENIHWRSGEWMPLIFGMDFVKGIYFILFFTLLYRYYKKITKFNLFLTLLMFIAGCSSIRHIPFFVIASIPIMTQSLYYFSLEAKKHRYGEMRLKKVYSGLLIACVIFTLVLTSKSLIILTSKSAEELYPVSAVKYLQNNLPKENLFSVFEWGGYLEVYLPQKKIFIDGRMDNWRLSSPEPHESSYIYGEDGLLHNGEIPFATAVKKYNIDTVLYYSPKVYGGKLRPYYYKTVIDTHLDRKTYSKYASLPVQLEQNGFKIVYQDNTAAVWVKKK